MSNLSKGSFSVVFLKRCFSTLGVGPLSLVLRLLVERQGFQGSLCENMFTYIPLRPAGGQSFEQRSCVDYCNGHKPLKEQFFKS